MQALPPACSIGPQREAVSYSEFSGPRSETEMLGTISATTTRDSMAWAWRIRMEDHPKCARFLDRNGVWAWVLEGQR